MKLRDEVTAEKLRGGFYTPSPLVAHCYMRIRELVEDAAGLRLLEPSVGGGAFIRGLADEPELADRIAAVHAIELVEEEAEKARVALAGAGVPGAVQSASTIAWATTTDDYFDVAVGNPPFVRYQFLPA